MTTRDASVRRVCLVALAVFFGAAAPAAVGQTLTWSGAGGNSSWSTAGNWIGGVAPTPSDTLEIILPASPTPTSYTSAVTGSNPFMLNRLTYGAHQYLLSGNTLRFAGVNATLAVNTTAALSGGPTTAFTNSIDLATDLTFLGNQSTNWWFRNISGVGGLRATGAYTGRWTNFSGTNSFAGATQLFVNAQVGPAGRIVNTPTISINLDTVTQRNILQIEGSRSVANAIGDAVLIDLEGGVLQNVTGDETVGRTTLVQGFSAIQSTSANRILRLSSLERANFATGAVSGPRLGLSGGARVLVVNADSQGRTITSQLIGGGGEPGSTQVSILPWLASSGAANATIPTSFVTYSAVSGFRALDVATEFVNNPTDWSALSPSDNVRIVFTGTQTITGNATINSLLLGATDAARSPTLAGSGRLTVNSGAILYMNNNGAGSINVSELDFAGREGVITIGQAGAGSGAALSIGSAIVNAGGVTFGGSGDSSSVSTSFTLIGASTYSGTTTVNAGNVMIGATSGDNRLPTTTVLNVARGASFGLSSASAVAGFNQTIAGLQGQGSVRNVGNAVRALTIDTANAGDTFVFEGTLGGTSANNLALVKNGAGTQTLTGTNTYVGSTTIGGGTLRIAGAGQLGSGTYAGAISNAGTLVFSSSANQVLTGVISGNGSLVQSGVGTLRLAAANTYAGSTSLQSAPLVLDFAAASSPASNILPSASALSMQGSTLQLVGNANTTNAQTVNGLAITGGASQVTLSANATANPLSLSVGAITRSTGATLNITNPAGSIGATNGLISSSENANGILGGWATVGNADWAVGNAGSGITALAAYTSDNWAAGNNTTVTTSSSPASDSTTNSLRFNNAGAATVTLAGVNTVTSGGVLVTSAAGANAQQIIGGTLRGSAGGELIVLQNNTGSDFTIGSVIADNGSATGLTKSGAGILALTGTSTFTGPMVINAGGVRLSGAGLLGSGNYAGAIANSGALRYAGSAQQTLSGPISGAGSLILDAGANTLSLTGISDFTGGTTITGGTLRIDGAGRLGSGTYAGALANNSAFVFASSANQSLAGVMSGTGSLTQAGAGLLSIDAAGTFGGNMTISSGTLRVGARGWLSSGTYAGSITNHSAFDYAGNLEQTLSGPISGSGSLAVTGSAALTLSGTNTYSGPTTIGAGGALQLTATSALYGGNTANWTRDNITVGSDGTLILSTGTTAGASTFTAANVASLLSGLGGSVNNNGLRAGSAIGLDTTAVGTSGTFSMTAAIADTTGSGGGMVGLVKNGVGTLATSATNTFTGPIQLNQGTLLISGSGLLGGGNYAGNIRTYGTLNYSSNLDQTFSGEITGDGTLNKSGTGVLTLTGTSAYIGNTTISAGGLRIGAAGVLGLGNYAGTIVLTGTLDHASSANQELSGVLNGAGRLVKSGVGLLSISQQANTLTGGVTITGGTLQISGAGRLNNGGTFAGAVANDATLDYATSASQILSGTLSGAGATIVSGSGRLILSGTNPYSGRFAVTGSSAGTGYLQFTRPSALYNNTASSWTKENISVGNGGVLVLSAGGAGEFSATNIETIAANLSTSIANNGLQAGSSIGISTANGNATFGGVIGDSTGTGGGAVGLVKIDGNSLTLTGVNTYTGATQVRQGSLVLAGGNNRINAASSIVLGSPSLGGSLALGDATGAVSQEFASLATAVGAGASSITNGATSGTSTLVISGMASGTFAGTIGGAGINQNNLSLTKSGVGMLVLGGTSTYTGPTTINGGVLQITGTTGLYGGNSANWTKTNISVGDGGTLVFSTGTAAATTAFTAANVSTLLTNLGGTVNNNGLQAGSAVGFDTGAVGNAGTFTVADAINDTTGSGGGAIGLRKQGIGRVILSGTSTFTGPMVITGGGIEISGRIGVNGTYAGNIVNNGQVAADGAGIAGLSHTGTGRQVLSGVISGSSTVLKNGSGTLVLTGTNLLTTVDPSITNGYGTYGTLPAGSISNRGSGVLLFGQRVALYNGDTSKWTPNNIYQGQSTTATIALSVGGSGEFTSDDVQTFVTQMLGTYNRDAGFASGYFGLDTTNAAGGIFTTNVPIRSVVNGMNAGRTGFNKLGTGVLELTGTNTFQKGSAPYGLVISEGTLRIGGAGTMNNGEVVATNAMIIQNSGELDWASSVNFTLAGTQIGTGSVRMSGSGILGLSGTQTYTGRTTVQSGTLQVNVKTALYGGTSANWTKENITVQNGALLALVSSSNAADFSAADMSTVITNLTTNVNNNGLLAGSAIGFNTNTGSLAFGGTINNSTGTGGGAVGVTKLGNNTLTLSASNGYTGSTAVLAGTLLISNSNALGGVSGGIQVNGGTLDLGSLRVARSGSVALINGTIQSGTIANDTVAFEVRNGTMSAVLTGLAGVQKTGTGSVTMSGSNSYEGATTVDNGTLLVSGRVGGAGGVVVNGGLLTVSGTNAGTGPTTINGGRIDLVAPAALYNGGTASWTASNITVGNGGIFSVRVGGGGFSTAQLTTLMTNLGFTGNAIDNNGLLAGSSFGIETNTQQTISTALRDSTGPGGGAIGLVKYGNNTLQLTGTNTFTGPITVAGGALEIATDGQLGATGSYAGAIVVNAPLIYASSRTQTLSGVISGVSTLTKRAASTLTLTGSNTYTGKTTIEAGVLAVSSLANAGVASPLGAATGANAVIDIGASTTAGTLRYTGSGDSTDRAINLAGTTGGATIEANGSGALVLTGANTATGNGTKTFTLSGTSTASNAIGAIAGTGVSVNKTGSGLWRLTGASSYTGQLRVLDGTLVVAANVGETGASPFGTADLSASLPLIGNAGAGITGTAALLVESDLLIERGFSVAAVGVGSSQVAVIGGRSSGSSQFTSNATITLNRSVTLQAASGGTVTFSNPWLNSGSSNVVTIGSAGNDGTIQLDNSLPSTLAGVSIVRGTARLRFDDNRIASATPVTVGSSLGSATLAIDGVSQTLSNLSFTGNSGSITGGTLRLANTPAVAVTGTGHVISSLVSLDAATSFNVNATSRLQIDSEISGSGFGLTKTGAGILDLAGQNTYTGNTTVSAGLLSVNGRLAGSASVASGGEIAGSGVIAGGLTGDGLIAPGNSPGILTVEGSVTPTASTAFAFELTAPGAPAWNNSTASVNDVLRLTNADPFTSSLASGNLVNIYFDVVSLSRDDTFLGGFFIDNPSGTANLLNDELGGAVFQYFVKGDGFGTFAYNGKNYYTFDEYKAANSGLRLTGVTRSVVNVDSADFAGGTITTGQVTQFVIVPEPGTIALAGIGIAAAAYAIRRRKS